MKVESEEYTQKKKKKKCDYRLYRRKRVKTLMSDEVI